MPPGSPRHSSRWYPTTAGDATSFLLPPRKRGDLPPVLPTPHCKSACALGCSSPSFPFHHGTTTTALSLTRLPAVFAGHATSTASASAASPARAHLPPAYAASMIFSSVYLWSMYSFIIVWILCR
ncbi:hypothetical protein E2562_031411 [Oryza meyeriana var. granulata]|uniref:Uncharacterized protein n=1 Tax=Oryza meyeriana var. granulata TaxID=110450 RepID=A0A6G1C178_9ORYZ|nr:hypothetical protein E2562_031411 [Oryza meyeriana var. granulata]